MNIRSHTHMDRQDVSRTSHTPAKGGLWKLLVAAALILVGLIASIEFFGNGQKGFVSPASKMQTIVE